jgi:hypothetical protein
MDRIPAAHAMNLIRLAEPPFEGDEMANLGGPGAP